MAAETAVEDDLVDVPDRGGSGARDEPPCCGEGFVRISYSYSIKHLTEAMRRIRQFLDEECGV